jgi:hypothetical protein
MSSQVRQMLSWPGGEAEVADKSRHNKHMKPMHDEHDAAARRQMISAGSGHDAT